MKKTEIGLSCTPSTITGTKEINVNKLLLSFGGGMGGSNITYYATSIKKNTDFWDITLYTGEKVEINPSFIVSNKTRKIVKVIADITQYINYSSKKLNSSIESRYFCLDYDTEYTINKDIYIQSPDNASLINTEVETT